MPTEIFSGRVRIQFQDNRTIDFRVMGENDEPGVEEALADVGRIEAHCQQRRIYHEAQKRKYRGSYRTDAVVIPLPTWRKGGLRRRRTDQKWRPDALDVALGPIV